MIEIIEDKEEMKCKYCGSTDIEYVRLKNGSSYPDIIHRPNCRLLIKCHT